MRRIAASLAVTAMVAASALVGASSVLAAPHQARATTPRFYYLSLGDSLARGVQPSANGDVETTAGYPDQLFTALRNGNPLLHLVKLGCPGETTQTMMKGGICTYRTGSQLKQAVAFLKSHPRRVQLVTIDIGANDITPCARGGVIDDACIQRAYRTIAIDLSRIVLRLRLAAPFTRMAAMNYYNPNLAAYLLGPAGQQFAQQALVVGNRLNALLGLIYRLAGFRLADVAAAFSTNDTTLTGSLPLNVARICQWTWMCAPPPLGPDVHANKDGYAVIARTFLAVLAT